VGVIERESEQAGGERSIGTGEGEGGGTWVGRSNSLILRHEMVEACNRAGMARLEYRMDE